MEKGQQRMKAGKISDRTDYDKKKNGPYVCHMVLKGTHQDLGLLACGEIL
jgi:hypothetical protein